MSVSNKTVIVGVSGGVDSSVSAALLKQQGYRVHAVFMQNWDEDDEQCTARQDYRDAHAVCQSLNIPLESVNFSEEYWDDVFSHFLQEYAAGRTPNPDILCNQEIKFKAFLDYALKQGADYIATGHYARTRADASGVDLIRGVDDSKDQSYFLYRLGQRALSHTLFPIGDIEKSEVRDMAQRFGLHNHGKRDSTGICFIGERRFNEFLSQYLPAQPGDIVSDRGECLGQHRGLMYHTIGQRKGLGIGGLSQHDENPWYVLEKDVENNQLIVGQGHDHPALLKNVLHANQLTWCHHTPSNTEHDKWSCSAKVRYRQRDQACHLQIKGDTAEVHFDAPVRAITPGQSIVFYQKDICLGGGIIL